MEFRFVTVMGQAIFLYVRKSYGISLIKYNLSQGFSHEVTLSRVKIHIFNIILTFTIQNLLKMKKGQIVMACLIAAVIFTNSGRSCRSVA